MPSSPEIIDVLLSIASGAEKREDRLVTMLNDIPHEQRGKLILDVLTKIVFDRLPAAVDEFVSAWELSGVPKSVLYPL